MGLSMSNLTVTPADSLCADTYDDGRRVVLITEPPKPSQVTIIKELLGGMHPHTCQGPRNSLRDDRSGHLISNRTPFLRTTCR